ncbi:MAG: hypothetical protein AABY64_00545 [Bdellovibrionota bacterium]
MINKIFFLVTLFFFVGTNLVQAQEIVNLVEKSITGDSDDPSEVVAKKEIQEEAINKVTEEILKDLIGSERVSKNNALIQNKIYRQWTKYIPYIKNNEIILKDKKFHMTVQMKLSVSNLRSLLKLQGLLIEDSTTPIFIPLVTFVDRVNAQQYQWWRAEVYKNSTFLNLQNQKFEKTLGQAFFKSGLNLIEPSSQKLHEQIPFAFQNENWTLEDDQFLALYFLSNVVLDGQVVIEKHPDLRDVYKIDFKIAAIQVNNGRSLAELQRRVDTEKGSYNMVVEKKMNELLETLMADLSTQVFDVWQRGSIGATLIRLSLKGKLSPLNQEALKEKLKSNITQIKNIKERLISTDMLVYEIDTTSNPKELSQKIQDLKIPGFQLQKLNDTDKEIAFQILGG